MHTADELGPNVSAFLAKLWKIVEDPATNDLVCWNSSGASFYIRDQARFARELLPLYYKHNNMASFVRQLNMYGFHKVVSIEGGGLRPDKDEMEFAHQCFLMDHPYLIKHIKRKIPVQRVDETVQSDQPDIIKKVLTDVKGLKGRQENLNSQLNEMKRENEVLWREVAVLRQKHLKQQQIVNKLIQFLVSMVHSTHTRNTGIGIKRFMLSHLPHNDIHPKDTKAGVSTSATSESSSGGPVIHEIDPADLLEECAATPEEETLPDNQEDFLSSDFCSEPGNVSSPNSSMGSMSSLEAAVNTASPDMLLELAEECSLQSDLLSSQVEKLQQSTKQKRRKSQSKRGNRKKRLKNIESENVANTEVLSSQQSVQSDNLKDVVLPSFTSENVQESSTFVPEQATQVDFDVTKAWKSLTTSMDSSVPSVCESVDDQKKKKSNVKLEIKQERNGRGPSTSTVQLNESRSSSPKLSLSRTVSSDLNRSLLPSFLTNFRLSGTYPMALPAPSILTGTYPKPMALPAPSILIGRPDNCDSLVISDLSEQGGMGRAKFRLPDSEDLDLHLDSMDSELDSIKELLKGEGYSLDASLLLGLFSEDPLAYELPVAVSSEAESNVAGSELMTYTPNAPNLDFTDLFGSSGGEDWRSSSPVHAVENTQNPSYSQVNTSVLKNDGLEGGQESPGTILGS